uniref:Uncharacterized protein n=1 Tax=Acrobeloides nanus TaxID=290746 RepID=A0A914C2B2_9BILA
MRIDKSTSAGLFKMDKYISSSSEDENDDEKERHIWPVYWNPTKKSASPDFEAEFGFFTWSCELFEDENKLKVNIKIKEGLGTWFTQSLVKLTLLSNKKGKEHISKIRLMSFDNEHTEPYEIEFGNYDYICQHYLFGKTIKLRIKIVYIENEPWGELNNELWDCIDKVQEKFEEELAEKDQIIEQLRGQLKKLQTKKEKEKSSQNVVKPETNTVVSPILQGIQAGIPQFHTQYVPAPLGQQHFVTHMQQPSMMHVLPPQPASFQPPPSYASASGSAAFDAEKKKLKEELAKKDQLINKLKKQNPSFRKQNNQQASNSNNSQQTGKNRQNKTTEVTIQIKNLSVQ